MLMRGPPSFLARLDANSLPFSGFTRTTGEVSKIQYQRQAGLTVLEQNIIVWSVTNRLAILENEIKVAQLCERGNSLLRDVGFFVDG
jgi:hypothetical protein